MVLSMRTKRVIMHYEEWLINLHLVSCEEWYEIQI